MIHVQRASEYTLFRTDTKTHIYTVKINALTQAGDAEKWDFLQNKRETVLESEELYNNVLANAPITEKFLIELVEAFLEGQRPEPIQRRRKPLEF